MPFCPPVRTSIPRNQLFGSAFFAPKISGAREPTGCGSQKTSRIGLLAGRPRGPFPHSRLLGLLIQEFNCTVAPPPHQLAQPGAVDLGGRMTPGRRLQIVTDNMNQDRLQRPRRADRFGASESSARPERTDATESATPASLRFFRTTTPLMRLPASGLSPANRKLAPRRICRTATEQRHPTAPAPRRRVILCRSFGPSGVESTDTSTDTPGRT